MSQDGPGAQPRAVFVGCPYLSTSFEASAISALMTPANARSTTAIVASIRHLIYDAPGIDTAEARIVIPVSR